MLRYGWKIAHSLTSSIRQVSVVSISALTRNFRYNYYGNLQFLSNIIIIKIKVLHHQVLKWFWLITLFRSFGFIAFSFNFASNTLKLLGFPIYFDIERTWWKIFQKQDVRTKLDIYVCVTIFKCLDWFLCVLCFV